MRNLQEYRRGLPKLGEKEKLTIPAFLSEVISQTTLLASRARSLSEAQRNQLLELSFEAVEFYKRVQRKPRVARELVVELSSSDESGQKCEVTKTIDVSRRGACVQTKTWWEVGKEIRIVSLDTKREARARIAWVSSSQFSEGRLGIEILDADDFWGLMEEHSRSRTPTDLAGDQD